MEVPPEILKAKKAHKAVAERKKILKRTLDNLDDDFGQVDSDKDGYLTRMEFGHLIQMHTDQSLRRGQKHLHPGYARRFCTPQVGEKIYK